MRGQEVENQNSKSAEGECAKHQKIKAKQYGKNNVYIFCMSKTKSHFFISH